MTTPTLPTYNKAPLSPHAQVQLLISKGLVVKDQKTAEEYFKRISFYRYKGYALIYRDYTQTNKPFYPKTSFEDVTRLIDLDAELRIILLEAIHLIEVSLRTIINEYMCATHGIRWYANSQLFNTKSRKNKKAKNNSNSSFAHRNFLSKCIYDFNKQKNELFVSHYNTKYNTSSPPPAWMLIETQTIGTWSLVFAHLNTLDKNAIALAFGVPWQVLESWLHVVSATRNACAHHARVWNKELGITPILPKLQRNTLLQNAITTDRKISAVIFVMHSMLKSADLGKNWIKSVKIYMKKYRQSELSHLGFKPRWEKDKNFQ